MEMYMTKEPFGLKKHVCLVNGFSRIATSREVDCGVRGPKNG